MATRAEQKQASLRRILDAAATRLRTEGLTGAAIAPVMQDAGLTHGAFYAHFADKDELAAAAFAHALKDNRSRWAGPLQPESWAARLVRLAQRYLTPAHRDNPADGCAFAAVATEAARASQAFHAVFEQEMDKSLRAICGDKTGDDNDRDAASPARRQDAVMILALCVGGVALSRAVANPATSDEILAACLTGAERLTAAGSVDQQK